jgi:8-oxo-dGTP pyrophosphatase MutT (NUDIX family)
MQPSPDSPESVRGVVAVVVREGRFLVIRRSATVRAPGMYCFPGGAIEPDETEEQALVREFQEELGAAVRPLSRVWQSTTPWRVELSWWLAECDESVPLVPNPAEVSCVHWLTDDQMRGLADLLESNLRFLDALASGEIRLR